MPDKMILLRHDENDLLCLSKILFKLHGRVDRRSA